MPGLDYSAVIWRVFGVLGKGKKLSIDCVLCITVKVVTLGLFTSVAMTGWDWFVKEFCSSKNCTQASHTHLSIELFDCFLELIHQLVFLVSHTQHIIWCNASLSSVHALAPHDPASSHLHISILGHYDRTAGGDTQQRLTPLGQYMYHHHELTT